LKVVIYNGAEDDQICDRFTKAIAHNGETGDRTSDQHKS
jgi:hypothetical protein